MLNHCLVIILLRKNVIEERISYNEYLVLWSYSKKNEIYFPFYK